MADTGGQTLVLDVANFFVENAVPLTAATIMFAAFCGITCLFNGDDGVAEREALRKLRAPLKASETQPQPKWFVLRFLNYLVLAVFISSLCFSFMKSRRAVALDGLGLGLENVSLFPFLILWSMCLAYFFGFFGITFVDKSAMERSPSSFGLDRLAPMHDAPICAERPRKAPRALPTPPPSGAPATDKTAAELAELSDADVVGMVERGELKDHALEKKLGDYNRAVKVRRAVYERRMVNENVFGNLPVDHFDYGKVFGANCEIVVGYVPLPTGIVGPLLVNDEPVFVPMATTEGCLVASTNRGCKAITACGGARAAVIKDGITRAPCLRMPNAMAAAALKLWVEVPENFARIQAAFHSTTSFGKLRSCNPTVAGRNVYLRCVCFAGDAMGMNMVSKGCLAVVELLQEQFPEMELIAISGNVCSDKKPAAVNWIEGRGKSVVCEATISGEVVRKTLKTTVQGMIDTNRQKCLIGSAMAGAVGGFNAHAANVVAAVFLATGQDPAQVVESANCITLMESVAIEGDEEPGLLMSVTMPSLEVGTVGGGTSLPAQRACLDVMGCAGASRDAPPGSNAQNLAMSIAAAVLAGEMSLMAALASNTLVAAHMTHNRKK